MQISKSSRHSKIVGGFGEQLVCNWLSRSGFEVSVVDHTGIDVLAYRDGKRFGISVKSRTRTRGKESEAVNVFQRPKDREHLMAACKAFGCEPWLAVYVECGSCGDLYLASLANYDKNYRAGFKVQTWRMTPAQKRGYASDSQVKHIHVEIEPKNWWGGC